MFRDTNPKHWKLLIFYYNPDAPLWVAKRYGAPLTLNFGKPMAWVVLGITFAAILTIAMLDLFHVIR